MEESNRALGLMCAALPGASGRVLPDRRPGPDLSVRWENATLLVEVKTVRGPRITEVEGALAIAVLSLRKHASQGEIPVVVVALNRFGRKLRSAVERFMRDFAPDVGWGLIDASDRTVLVIPPLELEWERPGSRPDREEARRDRQLFTDLNRWLLKVLLLPHAPDRLWGGPRERPRHPTELAGIARVSVGKAHRFASAFKAEGYLRSTRTGLRLVRVRALLDAWLQDEKNRSPRATTARAVFPNRVSDSPARDEPRLPAAAWSDSALGGFFAAERQGLLHASGQRSPLVHVRPPLSKAIREWGLERCDPRDGELVLSRPLYPQSVFRGSVERVHGAPLVDLWQIALDAVSSPARGQEQADFIVERVLALQEDE